MEVIRWILAAVIAYLLGSISTGIIVSKVFDGPNLRKVGSKSTGASNVLRTMGAKSGALTFLGDFAKAALSCGIGWWLTGAHGGALLAGLFVVIGHNWPVFYQFKGGKGVASSCAVMLICYPIPALIGFAIAIAVIAITRYISLGSMSMLVSYALMVSIGWAEGSWLVILWAAALAALCVWRHHANIGRLLHGNENKIGQKVSAPKENRK